jgi:hypothetical protein
MEKMRVLLGLSLMLAVLLLGSCGDGGDDDRFLGTFTGDCPRGTLAFWNCNMTWDEQCWQ